MLRVETIVGYANTLLNRLIDVAIAIDKLNPLALFYLRNYSCY